MVKKGDTLIEVTLAIGIFSMVAISVALVINSSTSGTQLSLETTLAREEIDTQAEVIRFIHDNIHDDVQYEELWKNISESAIEPTGISQYQPQTCEYDTEDTAIQHAFIINPRSLDYIRLIISNSAGNKELNPLTTPASTYPRLIFGDTTSNDSTELVTDSPKTGLYRAEGIYVVAVKGEHVNSGYAYSGYAYYDFYIRTCWYGTGNEEPSTISTVIRLSDPSITAPPSAPSAP